MMNTIIVTGITVMIIILSWYVVHDTEVYHTAVSAVKGGVKKMPMKSENKSVVKIANGPVVMIKSPDDYKYSSVNLEKNVVKIGSSAKNDIVLDDAAVEKVHARIEKKMKGNDIYYEFINLSKRNPAETLNQESNDYEYLGYRRGKVLGDCEVFYVGNTKLIIKRPLKHHQLTKTDRVVLGEKDNVYVRESASTIRIPSGSKTIDV